jgi:hypothetical protein
MGKAHIVLEIVLLLQGTPVYDFAQQNLAVQGSRVVVRCAQNHALGTVEGQACKIGIASAFRLYAYRFTAAQLSVLADLYATALEQLEPSAVPRVRARMCNPNSYESQQDPVAARAACDRLSMDF